jgi:hypothetical protein
MKFLINQRYSGRWFIYPRSISEKLLFKTNIPKNIVNLMLQHITKWKQKSISEDKIRLTDLAHPCMRNIRKKAYTDVDNCYV